MRIVLRSRRIPDGVDDPLTKTVERPGIGNLGTEGVFPSSLAISREPTASTKFFHTQSVTSNLVAQIQISDHGRGRDGRLNANRRAPKSFAV
jgi:hypothetical protein